MCYGNTVNPQTSKNTSIYIRAMLCDSNLNEIYQSDVRPMRVYSTKGKVVSPKQDHVTDLTGVAFRPVR